VTAGGGRRRAVLMLSLAVACGGMAASQVRGRERAIEARVGGLMPVLVARDDVAPGTRFTPERARRLLAVRQVPVRFAPADALSAPEEAAGRRTAAALGAGSYVTVGALTGEPEPEGGSGPGLRPGERALDLAVSGGEAVAALGGQGARVDVLVTTEPRSGSGRTFIALENAELLGARPGGAAADAEAGGAAPGATTIATLRVSPRQAVYLTAAQSFAREIRLLPRPAGDRRRSGGLAVEAEDL
jgi:pilus assembly protein CpaB